MPIQDITIGQFAPRNSCIHRLDPRTKGVAVFLLMAVLFFLKSTLFLLLFFLWICGLYGIASFRPSLALRNLRPFVWLFGLTLLLHAFFTQGSLLWRIPGTTIGLSKEGLLQGWFYSIRLANLMILAGLYTLTTSPMAFADSVEKMLSPFKRIGVPVHEMAMTMAISLRFIPILAEETERIQRAQASRGAGFRGNPVQKIRSMFPVLIPLFVSSFNRANDLALAMDSRCYRGGQNRTSYLVLEMKPTDWFTFGLIVTFGAILLLLDRHCI